MLSAFTAKPIVELKQRDKSKIEAILAYGDRLLIGLNSGSLRIYRVNDVVDENGRSEREPSSQSQIKAAELLREQEKFSKHKIEQLAIIKETNILISLSNALVSIHDLQSYELQDTLTKAKGATAFAVTSDIVKDEVTGIPSIVSRLAVAVKRRLILWSWHDSELSTETPEVTLATVIKSMTWATGTKIVAGLNSSYVMVDVETSAVTDIVGPGSIGGGPGQDGGRFGGVGVASIGYMGMSSMIPKPLATRLGEGELLLARDINTHFIDTNGHALGRRQIPWAVAPEAIGYSYPYLLSLQTSKGVLEVRNPETLGLLQSISLPNAAQLHVPQPNISLAHAGKGFVVSSERCVWRMGALEYDAQIDALADRGKLDEAISLLGMLEDTLLKDKEGRSREIKMLKAQELFDQRRYRSSLDLFTEVSAPPERVIRLFPWNISGDLSISVENEARLHRTSTGNSQDSKHKTTSLASISRDDENDSKSIKDVVKKAGKAESDTSSVKGKAIGSSTSQSSLEGRELRSATLELQSFLVDARTRLQRFLSPDGSLKEQSNNMDQELGEGSATAADSLLVPRVLTEELDQDRGQRLRDTAKLVDTTLFRAYMFASPSLAGPLFRLPNFCDADVVKEKLLETERFNDLIDFFYGKRLHRLALELLRKFGERDQENEKISQLHGPERTVAYLQALPPEMIDLILEFAYWPLKTNTELAMEIFVADTENAETLPRRKVLDFLQTIDKRLAVRYLEHIIEELNDTSPEFHQRLIDVYLEGLRSEEFRGRRHQDQEERDAWNGKFLRFLKTSPHYQFSKVLGQLPRDDPDVYEARAIVLGKMGQHRQALDIYVFKLQNPDKAEEYCNQIHLTEEMPTLSSTSGDSSLSSREDRPPSIYHTLLSLYLSPPPPHKSQWGPALNILAKHGPRLPASSTLDLIPEVLPIKELESYFRARIRSANTLVSSGRVAARLREVANIEMEAKLRLGDDRPDANGGRNRRVTITEERLCGVCHRRFGGSAIKVLPDDTVVHYGCSTR